MPTPSFDRAIAIVLVNEGGGKYTDPTTAAPGSPMANDRGGPTKYGITLNTLSAWRAVKAKPAKAPSTTATDVKNLTEIEARAIYLAMYWAPLKCEQLTSQALATALLDAGVLHGVGTAAKLLQAAVGATADGQIGPKTLAAVAATDLTAALFGLSTGAQAYQVKIARNDPSQQQLLVWWLKRAAVMQAMPFLLP